MEYFDFFDFIDNKVKVKKPTVIAIGVFEAMHKGHQAIVEKLLEQRTKFVGSEAIIITFSINPKPGRTEKIDTLRLREENFEISGIDATVTIDFSQQFSKISASEFLEMLISSMDLKAIVVGEDFRFGTPLSSASAYEIASMLKSLGSDASVEFVAPILMEGGEKISSTLLRRMIKEGKLEEFLKFSGQYYTLDLLESPFAEKNYVLVIRASDIHQLLPPQGVYESKLVLDNGFNISCLTKVSDNEILISLEEESLREKVGLSSKINKLLLEKERNDYS